MQCYTYGALTRWFLGYPEQALQQMEQALVLARALAHPFSLVFALSHASVLHLLRGEALAVQAHAEAVMALATEQGFPAWVAQGTVLRGWALAAQGQGVQGLEQMQQGAAVWQKVGPELGQPFFLGLLAERYGQADQVAAGRQVLEQALAVACAHGLRMWEAELRRLQGELGLRSAPGQRRTRSVSTIAAAESCLRQALDLARQQGVKAWELRAALSLSRLWQQQSRQPAARELLAGVYAWFTEGFATADLQAARALLEELA